MAHNYIKFSFIALCFLIALYSYRFCVSKKDWTYLSVAMGFTLISDFFLVLAGNYRAGVFFFCFAHMAYILRVNTNRSVIRIGAAVLAGVMIGGLLYFILPVHDFLVILAAVYASLFLQNLSAHVRYCRSGGPDVLPLANRWLMLSGLILFALCDVHVMLFSLPDFLPVPEEIGHWGLMWIWIFYTPSQLLLSISAIRWYTSLPAIL